MAYAKDLQLPRVGEAIDSAQITHLSVADGDSFAEGDILLEIETDKSVIEVPAPEAGKLLEWRIGVDDVIDADTVLARIEVAGEPPADEETPEEPEKPVEPAEVAAEEPAAAAGAEQATAPPAGAAVRASRPAPALTGTRVFATPAARKAAREHGLSLDAITGSGPNGRIIRADVTRAANGGAAQADATVPAGGTAPGSVDRDVSTAHGMLHVRQWPAPSGASSLELVMIHGLFGDVDVWTTTARAANRAGFGVTAIDLPCHGTSRSSASAVADIIEAASEAIGSISNGPVVLVGHSFGGAIAAGVAATGGLDVRSLVLIAPIGLGTEVNQSFLAGMTNAGSIPAVERETRKLTVAGTTPSGDYLETLRQRLQERGGALAALCQELSHNGVQQVDISRPLSTLRCPLTLIHGRNDAIVPWEHALQAPPRTALHLLPGVGHMPQWEATSLTMEIITRAARAGQE